MGVRDHYDWTVGGSDEVAADASVEQPLSYRDPASSHDHHLAVSGKSLQISCRLRMRDRFVLLWPWLCSAAWLRLSGRRFGTTSTTTRLKHRVSSGWPRRNGSSASCRLPPGLSEIRIGGVPGCKHEPVSDLDHPLT
jgi:hypothetical protein